MRRPEVIKRSEYAPKLEKFAKAEYALGNYPTERLQRIMWKYLVRRPNLEKAWVRMHHHAPELLTGGPKKRILEFSTAHGANLEVLRHFGHDVRGTDYNWVPEDIWSVPHPVRKPWHGEILKNVQAKSHKNQINPDIQGWPYQPIIESLGIEVDIFNGGELPYKYDDKSFDYIFCYQAIDAYGPPERWAEFLTEFCRIAKTGVIVGFNSLAKHTPNYDQEYKEWRKAWTAMQRHSAHGLQTVFFEMGNTLAGEHPTLVKLMAI